MHSECENDIKDGRVFLFNYNIFKNKWNTILQKSKDILSMLKKKRVPTVKNQIASDLFLFCASFLKNGLEKLCWMKYSKTESRRRASFISMLPDAYVIVWFMKTF